MSNLTVRGNPLGTGTVIVESPNTSTNRTITLPDQTGTLATTADSITQTQLNTAMNASGSAPFFACRAWANFNGVGAVTIRASGNIGSIVRNAAGTYTVTFTTAMPDANYAVVAFARRTTTSAPVYVGQGSTQTQTASSFQITVAATSANIEDSDNISIAVFR